MAARKNDWGKIDKFFNDIEREVIATASVAASSYAKGATKSIAEEWAEILARNIELGLITPPLAEQTKDNRMSRGNPEFPAWLETGELVSHIEFRWTRMPSRNYDLLEVGIWDDSTQIGHKENITPYKLGLINEYGFKGTFKGKDENSNNEKTYKVNIPARPHFLNSAADIGYESDRIISDSWRKVQIAIGREKRSIIRNNLSGNLLNDLSISASRRVGGSGPNEVITGRFYVSDREITFGWDEDD